MTDKALVRLVHNGTKVEERPMDRVPVVGEVIQMEDESLLYVLEIFWRVDGHASLFLSERDPKSD